MVISRLGDAPFVIERADKENLVIQWFSAEKRVWIKAGGARQLWTRASDILREAIPDIECGLLGNGDFLRKVVDLVKGKLDHADQRAQLDGDRSQFLLRFQDGMVLDFRTGLLRPCVAEDRISMGVPYVFPPWNDQRRDDVTKLLVKLLTFGLRATRASMAPRWRPSWMC